MSIKLDLSKFKHLKSDKHSTTLQHKAGHMITLAHSALSPATQKQLGALSKIGKEAMTSDQANEAHDQKYAKGGDVNQPVHNKEQVKKEYREKNFPKPNSGGSLDYNKIREEFKQKNRDRKMYADGTDNVQPDSALSSIKSPDEQEQNPGLGHLFDFLGDSQGRSDWNNQRTMDNAPKVASNGATGDWSPDQPQAAPQPPPAMRPMDANTPPPSQTGEDPADRAPAMEANDPATDAQGNGPAQPQQPNPVAQAAEQVKAPEQQFQEHKQQVSQELNNDAQATAQDLNNGHITPLTYQKLMGEPGTLKRVSSIFGLMLSGAGAGLTHQPNAFMEMMNNQIKNDVDAQVKSKENAQNLYKLNLQSQMQEGQLNKMVQEGHLTDAQANQVRIEAKQKALALTYMQANHVALHSLSLQADKEQDPAKKQQMMQTLAMLHQGVQNENYNLADRAATATAYGRQLFGQQGQAEGNEQAFQQKMNGMRMLGPDGEKRAEDMQNKHIPGIPGASTSPIDKSSREKIEAHQKMEMAASQLKDFVAQHGGIFDRLSPANRAIAAQMVLPIQAGFREGTLGTVYREGEQPLLDKAVRGQPLDMAQYFLQTEPKKLDQLRKTNSDQMNLTLHNLGFPQQPGSKAAEPQYKTVKGVKYMRGPNGEAVPVK